MKDLKAFMTKVSEDNKLAEKVAAAKSAEEVVSIAAESGYKFTADDLMENQLNQVAGGNGLNSVGSALNVGVDTVNAVTGAVTGVIDSGVDPVNSMIGGVNDMVSSGKKAVLKACLEGTSRSGY